MSQRVVIIGSGLGGLECGYILAKKGFEVCVAERSQVLGGCLQTFKRGNTVFDTGFHYVGGLAEGQALHRLFQYFELDKLPWQRMDDAFDEITVDGQSFSFYQGHQAFCEAFCEAFPDQKDGIKAYTRLLRETGEHLFDSFLPRTAEAVYSQSLFARSAREFIHENISNPLLRKLLTGASLKMELSDQLPLYTYAQINNSFIESAWRIKGGGEQIAEHLAQSIEAMGGTVRRNTEITELVEQNGRISELLTAKGERIACDWVISNAHPAYTLGLLKSSSLIRPIYRRRIQNLANTFGFFTSNLRLKPGLIPYCNFNRYLYRNADPWHYDGQSCNRVLVSYYADDMQNADGCCTRLDLLTPMLWSEVEAWADAPMGKRGQSYVDMKRAKTDACIQLAAERIPGLAEAVERDFTSTPLSYRYYTNTVCGSAYGVCKDYSNPMLTLLPARTPVPNLLLTGQNLNLHGILGVSMTSFFTAAEIVGMDTLSKDLHLTK